MFPGVLGGGTDSDSDRPRIDRPLAVLKVMTYVEWMVVHVPLDDMPHKSDSSWEGAHLVCLDVLAGVEWAQIVRNWVVCA